MRTNATSVPEESGDIPCIAPEAGCPVPVDSAAGESRFAPAESGAVAANEEMNATPPSWTERLADVMHHARDEAGPRLHTTLSCSVRDKRPMLFLPPEMGTLQPRSLAWLRPFARHHGFGLVEDRRRTDVRPIIEQREHGPTQLALGISLLLKQTGMPGEACTLSNPHRLNADGRHIGLVKLVRMAARARARSKRVVLLPNRLIVDTTGQATHPIVAHACRLSSPRVSTLLSQFESPAFRCIGYASGRQYVVHVFLAGGTADASELWTRLHTLTHTAFRFRLFPGKTRQEDFGLFHKTFHYDLADDEKAPWWLSEAPGESDDEGTIRIDFGDEGSGGKNAGDA